MDSLGFVVVGSHGRLRLCSSVRCRSDVSFVGLIRPVCMHREDRAELAQRLVRTLIDHCDGKGAAELPRVAMAWPVPRDLWHVVDGRRSVQRWLREGAHHSVRLPPLSRDNGDYQISIMQRNVYMDQREIERNSGAIGAASNVSCAWHSLSVSWCVSTDAPTVLRTMLHLSSGG